MINILVFFEEYIQILWFAGQYDLGENTYSILSPEIRSLSKQYSEINDGVSTLERLEITNVTVTIKKTMDYLPGKPNEIVVGTAKFETKITFNFDDEDEALLFKLSKVA